MPASPDLSMESLPTSEQLREWSNDKLLHEIGRGVEMGRKTSDLERGTWQSFVNRLNIECWRRYGDGRSFMEHLQREWSKNQGEPRA